ncbi:unnamed protein product [Protopolystoma xenopodis]|uniref:Uncharacterized protein n=1 Tax=Protopolystoma xenopodis TaxID=117903 RepID=A0A3S5A9T2_9PLAT|nr:unnamed protein product [Protopolystoma xenopodis]
MQWAPVCALHTLRPAAWLEAGELCAAAQSHHLRSSQSPDRLLWLQGAWSVGQTATPFASPADGRQQSLWPSVCQGRLCTSVHGRHRPAGPRRRVNCSRGGRCRRRS